MPKTGLTCPLVTETGLCQDARAVPEGGSGTWPAGAAKQVNACQSSRVKSVESCYLNHLVPAKHETPNPTNKDTVENGHKGLSPILKQQCLQHVEELDHIAGVYPRGSSGC